PIPRRGALHDSLGNTSPACTAPSPLGGKVGVGHGRRRADGARPGRFMPAGVPPRAPRAAPLLLPPLAGEGRDGGTPQAGRRRAGRPDRRRPGAPTPALPRKRGRGRIRGRVEPGRSGPTGGRTPGERYCPPTRN